MAPDALVLHRASQVCERLKLPLWSNVLAFFSGRLFRAVVSPRAQLGQNVELGYNGLGIFIDDGVTVGDNTFIAQEVTIGQNPQRPGVPRVGKNVLIGAGAKILGPVTIGDGAAIGANAVVVDDVPPFTTVTGNPARVLRRHTDRV
jgi:serine O-acetyltransferase